MSRTKEQQFGMYSQYTICPRWVKINGNCLEIMQWVAKIILSRVAEIVEDPGLLGYRAWIPLMSSSVNWMFWTYPLYHGYMMDSCTPECSRPKLCPNSWIATQSKLMSSGVPVENCSSSSKWASPERPFRNKTSVKHVLVLFPNKTKRFIVYQPFANTSCLTLVKKANGRSAE